MEIIPVIPRGYCKGVVNAINLAKQCSYHYPNMPITALGMIVHNEYVVKALEYLNIKTLDAKGKTRLELLDKIESGIVLFTAHGVSERVIQKARQKGLICVDASCSDVICTQQKIKQRIQEGYTIFYIGQNGHPEAEAIVSSSDQVILIDSMQAVDHCSNSITKVYVTNQTTMSIMEIDPLIQAIQKKYPTCLVEQEICNATRMRQEAILRLENVDLLYVVGDPHSNNANKLKKIALNHDIPCVYLITDCSQLQLEQLKNHQRIAVTAGASTPTYLTQQVIDVLQHYAKTKEWILPKIDLQQML